MNMFRRKFKSNVKKKLIRKKKVYVNLNNVIMNVIKINDD